MWRRSLAKNDYFPMPVQNSPEKNESLMGFVLRMANINTVQGIHWLYQRLGRDKLNRFKFEDCEEIAKTFGTSTERIERAMWRRRYRDGLPVQTLGSVVVTKPYLIRPLRPQVCTKCLNDSGYCYQTWDFQFVSACPHHECSLIDQCPQCARYIQWMRPFLLHCNCGMALTEVEPKNLTSVDASVRIASLIHSKLESGISTTPQVDALETALSSLSIDAISKLIWMFGSKESSSSQVGTGRSQRILRTEDAAQFLERGYSRLRAFSQAAALEDVSTILDSVHIPALEAFVRDVDSVPDIRFADWLTREVFRQSNGKYKLGRAGRQQLHLF